MSRPERRSRPIRKSSRSHDRSSARRVASAASRLALRAPYGDPRRRARPRTRRTSAGRSRLRRAGASTMRSGGCSASTASARSTSARRSPPAPTSARANCANGPARRSSARSRPGVTPDQRARLGAQLDELLATPEPSDLVELLFLRPALTSRRIPGRSVKRDGQDAQLVLRALPNAFTCAIR